MAPRWAPGTCRRGRRWWRAMARRPRLRPRRSASQHRSVSRQALGEIGLLVPKKKHAITAHALRVLIITVPRVCQGLEFSVWGLGFSRKRPARVGFGVQG